MLTFNCTKQMYKQPLDNQGTFQKAKLGLSYLRNGVCLQLTRKIFEGETPGRQRRSGTLRRTGIYIFQASSRNPFSTQCPDQLYQSYQFSLSVKKIHARQQSI
jgi:hypothetical protein